MDLFEVITPIGQNDEHAWLKTVDYRLCESVADLREYLRPAVEAKQPISADWESSSLNFYNGKLFAVGLSVSAKHGTARYVPLLHIVGAEHNLPIDEVLEVLKWADVQVPLVFYGYKYDGHLMRYRFDWEPEHWEDAIIAVYLEDSNQKQFGLKFTSQRLLGIKMLEYEDVAGAKNFSEVHPLEAVNYACADADMTRRLWLLPKVQAAIKDQNFIYTLEKKLLPVIRDGINAGVYLDKARLQKMRDDIGAEIKVKGKVLKEATGEAKKLREKIFELAGGPFELDSPQKLGTKLIQLGVPILERTDGDQIATGKEVLEKYAPSHPICEAIVQYRELNTQCRNYLDKLISAYDHFGALVRFSFNSIGAPTGRMSAGGEGKKGEAYEKGFVDLNVQSIPDHEKKKYLPNIRSAFVANDPTIPEDDPRADEWVWVSIDYSQIEMRVAANLSREPAWIKSFAEGADFHETNAKLAYGDPEIVKKDKNARKKGKTMGFAVLFQASPDTVAAHGNIAVEVAKKLIDTFYANAPTLCNWIAGVKRSAESNKCVKTYFGRLRRLEEYFTADAPRWLREKGKREAVNSPVQGGAADVFKIACYKTWKLVRERWPGDAHQILWIHDELNFRVRRVKVAEVVPQILKTMEFEVKGWPVEIKAEAEVGWNWGELVKLQEWLENPPERVRTALPEAA